MFTFLSELSSLIYLINGHCSRLPFSLLLETIRKSKMVLPAYNPNMGKFIQEDHEF